VRTELTVRAGLAAVSEFEDDHGPFSRSELAEADRWIAAAIRRTSQTGMSHR
jgi:hypothetical protein